MVCVTESCFAQFGHRGRGDEESDAGDSEGISHRLSTWVRKEGSTAELIRSEAKREPEGRRAETRNGAADPEGALTRLGADGIQTVPFRSASHSGGQHAEDHDANRRGHPTDRCRLGRPHYRIDKQV